MKKKKKKKKKTVFGVDGRVGFFDQPQNDVEVSMPWWWSALGV